MEQEKRALENAQRQIESLRGELSQSLAVTAQCQVDLQALAHTERVMNELSARMSEIADANRQLATQLHEKQDECDRLQEAMSSMANEKLALTVCVDRYESQLRARDEAVRAYEARIDTLNKDVEKLRQRQINPELERTIRHTQSMLMLPGQQGNQGGGLGMSDSWNGMHGAHAFNAYDTADMGSPTYYRSTAPGSSQVDSTLRRDTDDLSSSGRPATTNLSNNVLKSYDDGFSSQHRGYKMGTGDNRLGSSAVDPAAASRHSDLHESLRHSSNFGNTTGSQFYTNFSDAVPESDGPSNRNTGVYFPSRQGIMNLPNVDEMAASGSSVNNDGRPSRSDFLVEPQQTQHRYGSRQEARSSAGLLRTPVNSQMHQIQPQASSNSGYTEMNNRFVDANANRTESSFRHNLSVPSPSNVTLAPGGHTTSPTQQSSSGRLESTSQSHLQPAMTSSGQPASSVTRPFQATANSGFSVSIGSGSQSSRLSKLGGDLQLLAKKLDSFETGSGSGRRQK
jgi:hypothetical protein